MTVTILPAYAVIFMLAYLIGSIPSGVLVTRFFFREDIRKKGSGNIGATNVARVAGLRLGLLTLVLDLLKGAGPVYLAGISGFGAPESSMTTAALAAVGGHMFPVYNRMRGGGKGVATAAGCFLVIAPMACLTAVILFVLAVLLTRRVSIGSMAAAVALPFTVWVFTSSTIFFACAGVIGLLVILRHKDNIVRLASGTEPAFSRKRKR